MSSELEQRGAGGAENRVDERETEALEVPRARRHLGQICAGAAGIIQTVSAVTGEVRGGLAAAAVVQGLAGYAERQSEDERHYQAQRLTSVLQEKALAQDLKHHDRDRRMHSQAILADLREHDKEADRDLWEQRTERFQTLMTISSLLFGACVALAVEGPGNMPEELGEISLELRESVRDAPIVVDLAALHYGLLGAGLGLNVCVVLGCRRITQLFAEFMDERLRGQAAINKDMREAAAQLMAALDRRGGEEEKDESAPPDSVERCEDKLAKALERQYIVKHDLSGHDKSYECFADWYDKRCRFLEWFVERCFHFTMGAMLLALATFTYAHLCHDDELEYAPSAPPSYAPTPVPTCHDDELECPTVAARTRTTKANSAWYAFAYALLPFAASAIIIPQWAGETWLEVREALGWRETLGAAGAVAGAAVARSPEVGLVLGLIVGYIAGALAACVAWFGSWLGSCKNEPPKPRKRLSGENKHDT